MEEVSTEELQQQEADAFEAGFAEASGAEVVPPAEPKPAEAPVVEQTSEPEQEEVIPEFGLTPSAIRARLAKVDEVDQLRQEMQQLTMHRDRQYGVIGEMKQRMQQLQEMKPAQPSVHLTAGNLKRLQGEYPELAELLAQDLSEAVSLGGAAPSVGMDSQQIEQMLAQRTAEVERRAQDGTMKQVQELLLARDHPDWKAVAASSDFSLWKANLDPRERTMLDSSWDSGVISSAISAFKGWRDKQTERVSSKKQRLERAIQPNGVYANSDTAGEADAFMAGFNAVRSQRI